MDNPFLPALICFGPFFLFLFFHLLTRRGQQPKPVPSTYVAAGILIAFAVGMTGVAFSFLLK